MLHPNMYMIVSKRERSLSLSLIRDKKKSKNVVAHRHLIIFKIYEITQMIVPASHSASIKCFVLFPKTLLHFKDQVENNLRLKLE